MTRKTSKFIMYPLLIIFVMYISYKIDNAKNFLELVKVIIKNTLSVTAGYILIKIKEMK